MAFLEKKQIVVYYIEIYEANNIFYAFKKAGLGCVFRSAQLRFLSNLVIPLPS